MERVLLQTGRNTLAIMTRLPVYYQDRIDLVNKLERNGYGIPRDTKTVEPIDLSSIFCYSVVALALVGMIVVFH